jgi:energy-coupling factor transport system permease protein
MGSIPDIILGDYVEGSSLLHRLDPRLKLGAGLVLMGAPFALIRPEAVVMHTVLTAGTVFLSGIPFRAFLRSLRFFLTLLLVTAALHLFFTPGIPLAIMGPVAVTREGAAGGALTAWRLLCALVMSALLTHTTTPLQITRGLEAIMAPLGRPLFGRIMIPVQDLSLMMMMTLRFVPVLAEEARRVHLAQKSRGADWGRGGPRARSRALISFFIPLFAGTFRRADELAAALEARGFMPGALRTSMHPLEWTRRDMAGLLLAAFWIAILAVLQGA